MIKSIWQVIIQGGPVMVPIIIISLIVWALIIEKLFELNRENINVDIFTDKLIDLWKKGRKNEAIKLCKSTMGIVPKVLEKGLAYEGKTKESIMDNIREVMLKEYPKLEQSLPTIGTLASAAPLLGLLGTVTGMISTFTAVTLHGTGNPQALAKGISEALITTQSGLIVAIPALFFHNYLVRKLTNIMDNLGKNIIKLINIIFRDNYSG